MKNSDKRKIINHIFGILLCNKLEIDDPISVICERKHRIYKVSKQHIIEIDVVGCEIKQKSSAATSYISKYQANHVYDMNELN